MIDRGLPILTYHALDTSGSVISTDPRWFATTMKALHAEGFQCVDLDRWIRSGRPQIDRGFAITFDDGLDSIVRAADSIARFEFTATAFLVTGRMGGDNQWPGQSTRVPCSRLLDWPDLKNLQTAGFRFAAHTIDHPDLNRCGDDRLEAELAGSRQAVEDHLGTACNLVAYPCGRTSRRVRIAASRHFQAGLGTRLDFATSRQDPFSLSRIDAYYLQTPQALNRLLSGRAASWLGARRVGRVVRRAICLA